MSFAWDDMIRITAARLQIAYGWDEERALQCADLVADTLRQQYGGSRHYLPARNGDFKRRIVAEFNGRNITELSRIYGVSAKTIRRYVARNGHARR
jgi:Mor family transcriptional regulator